jgi:hypothetical protein
VARQASILRRYTKHGGSAWNTRFICRIGTFTGAARGGNAIVPQVAAEVIAAYMEIADS